jgi:hypothetical protein
MHSSKFIITATIWEVEVDEHGKYTSHKSVSTTTPLPAGCDTLDEAKAAIKFMAESVFEVYVEDLVHLGWTLPEYRASS